MVTLSKAITRGFQHVFDKIPLIRHAHYLVLCYNNLVGRAETNLHFPQMTFIIYGLSLGKRRLTYR
jgi:hypothetical protein